MAELVALPASITVTPAKTVCCGSNMIKAAQPSCKKARPCKKQQKDCNADTCCINCPLCYAVTMPVTAEAGKLSGALKKEYPAFQSSYLFIYYSTSWKPPNGC